MKNNIFSWFLKNHCFHYFSFLGTYFGTLFHLVSAPRTSFGLPLAPLGAIWGSLWASLGLLWRPLASLSACQGASWSQFKQFEAPKPHSATISNGISMIFHEFW